MTTEPGEKIERYSKLEIASKQLETAVLMFLNARDPASVITLAGASGNILSQLLRNAGKEPFADYSRRVHNSIHGFTPSREKYGNHVANRLGINVLKHMSKDDPDEVELDLEKCAADAVLKTLTDYVKLNGQEEPFVRAMLSWAWKEYDGEELMKAYHDIPRNLRS